MKKKKKERKRKEKKYPNNISLYTMYPAARREQRDLFFFYLNQEGQEAITLILSYDPAVEIPLP